MKIRKAAFATGAFILSSTLALAQQQPIKIGFVAELSGPTGSLGQDMYDAFMLVVDRNGGKLGGVPVQVIKRDSQLKPEVANQIAEELIEKEKVPIIAGITFSNVMMAIYKRMVDSEVFLIGSNASPSPIAGAQCCPFYFQVTAQNDQQAEAMGRYATDKGYKHIITMAPNYQAGKDYIAGFKREYKRPLLDEIYTPLNQLDFRPADATRREESGCRLRLLSGRTWHPVRPAMVAIRTHGKIPLLAGSTVDGITLPALQDAAVGVFHGSHWAPNIDNPANKEFVQQFEQTLQAHAERVCGHCL